MSFISAMEGPTELKSAPNCSSWGALSDGIISHQSQKFQFLVEKSSPRFRSNFIYMLETPHWKVLQLKFVPKLYSWDVLSDSIISFVEVETFRVFRFRLNYFPR